MALVGSFTYTPHAGFSEVLTFTHHDGFSGSFFCTLHAAFSEVLTFTHYDYFSGVSFTHPMLVLVKF